MHLHGLSDIRQHHGLHKFRALLKERLLLLDDAARNFQQGVVAAFQALDQPFRFLQIAADVLTVAVVTRAIAQRSILLIDLQPWDAVAVELDRPHILHFAYQHVRDHVLRFAGVDRLAWTRIE
ncbi:hypothetical protein D3C79_921920 [compost metagenome]